MNISCRYFCALICIWFISLLICSQAQDISSASKFRVMSLQEFKKAINNNEFLKRQKQTVDNLPLDKHEIKEIEEALKEENNDYGGEFDAGREIRLFKGSTLLVGGGKQSGKYGDNQGKTVLIDDSAHEKEIDELIEKLRSEKWIKDPYTGKEFKTDDEKTAYIKILERKKALYKEAFTEKNKDTLYRYYTLNIDKNVQPDMVGSITSELDMSKIPDKKFMVVEFENVPCHVFINPKLYPILERITMPAGMIKFSVSNVCRRLILPVIQSTKFGNEFTQKLERNFIILKRLHPTYNRITLTVRNN